jgi:thiol-disulfide isomerase/thioredoxin
MRLMIIIMLLWTGTVKSQGQKIDFALPDLENRQRTFKELMGEKLTLIDFWASWCRPCMRAIPELNLISSEYKAMGVNVIGINCDGPRSASKVLPLSRALQINYPVIRDEGSDVMKSLNLTSFPTLLIVNRLGEILWIHDGFIPGDEVKIKQQIDKFLKN